MEKERFLTILVPITDADIESPTYPNLAALMSAVPVNMDNVDKIYKVDDGTYYRLSFNTSSGEYCYQPVIDREFPYLGKPLEIFNFTYNSTRMGTAPTISAQGVMWFADKDADGNDVTLEGKWAQECHVTFNGDNFYLKQIPTSSKSNEDARYKYDIDFVSERVVLESVYLYDVVSPFITEKPISESAVFSFYGDINEFAKRINASLIRSGLATLNRKHVDYDNHAGIEVPYLSYTQWCDVESNPSSLVGEGNVFPTSWYYNLFRTEIFLVLNGDYNLYLMRYIYVNENGMYTLNGYRCVIGKDKNGNQTESEEKLVSFDNKTIHEALQEFHDTFGLQYYIAKEKNAKGAFTGNTIIWVADCEHDFADLGYVLLTSEPSDWSSDYFKYYKIEDGEYVLLSQFETWVSGTYYKYDLVRDDDGIPTTKNPFDYGVSDALLSKEKANTTDKIVTRITGVGSSENIPWYYPNPNPDGWIKPIYKKNGVEQSSVIIDYPTSEGSTIAQSARYEKYLKNRIGNKISFGILKDVIYGYGFSSSYIGQGGLNVRRIVLNYTINTSSISYPKAQLYLYYGYADRLVATLTAGGVQSGYYDSTVTYTNPTSFQSLFINSDGSSVYPFAAAAFDLQLEFYISELSFPLSKRFDYEGYHYGSVIIPNNVDTSMFPYTDDMGYIHVLGEKKPAYLGEEFYTRRGLVACASFEESITTHDYGGGHVVKIHNYYPKIAGRSTNGSIEGIISPIHRINEKQYKDVPSGTIYRCNTSTANNINTGFPSDVFEANPKMELEEWANSVLNMRFSVYSDDGWWIGNKQVELSDYGINGLTYNGDPCVPDLFDVIEFKRVKYVTPQQNLMPEVYIKTDGERRFYNAHNYWDKDNSTLLIGTADPMIGEMQVGTKVRNPIYKEKESDSDNKHYQFENEYIQSLPHEHIEDFEDVKPTIKEQENYIKVEITSSQFNSNKPFFYIYDQKLEKFVQCSKSSTYDSEEDYYALLRIDVVEKFDYDQHDNDEIWESNDNGSIQGEYKHPYFFAKLRPLGFNIFDLALQEDMVISMTTGNCGACNFKIGVDENTQKNPIQIWEYDVYGGRTWETKGEKLYSKGELRRYVDTSSLYYDTNGQASGYHLVDIGFDIISGGSPIEGCSSAIPIFDSYVYSSYYIENGYVGAMKQEGKLHFEGDVMTSGRFIQSQQDTTDEFVWVALMKDTDTYGTIMPAARPYYDDHQLDVYIRPKSIQDVSTPSSTFEQDEENADKFVFINIRLPQVYLRRAERDLSRKLVAYMYDNNYQKFNFSIKFSRIFLAQSPDIDDNLNENSVLYVTFNNRTYRQYVKNYTYRMSEDTVLPEINVDMNEELSVSRTLIEQQSAITQRAKLKILTQLAVATKQAEERISKKTVGKNGNTILGGNIISRSTGTSLVEIGKISKSQSEKIYRMDVKMETDFYTRKDFKVENGSDLNIGGEVFLPTLRKSGGILYRRKWDAEREEFVFDDSEVFAPAFIDNTDKRLLDYHGEYQLLSSEPEDFTSAFYKYYKLINGEYKVLEEPETFASSTYYKYVESVENNSITPARVSAGQINFGASGVVKPLYMSSNKISEKNYELLETQPSDWNTQGRSAYYKKDANGDYELITGFPAFAENTFYREVSTEYSVALTEEYTHIVQAFDQLEIALHCATVTITQDGQGGYIATFNYSLPPARQNPEDPLPDRCSSETGNYWFRTTT